MDFTPRLAFARVVAALLTLTLCAAAQEDPGLDLFYSANALYNRKLFPIAIKEFQNFLQAHPTHAKADHARYGLAMSYYSAAMYKEAEPLFKELIQKGTVGDKHQLALLRGHSLLRTDNPGDAEAVFVGVANAPDAGVQRNSALLGLSEAAFKQQKWADVAKWTDALLAGKAADPEIKRALYQGAWARHQLAKYDEAIPMLERLSGLIQPGDGVEGQTAYLMGECYREAGKLRESATWYEKAAQAFSGSAAAEVHYRLGYVQYLLQRYDDAVPAFEAAIKADPQGKFGDTARLYLGRSFVENRQYDRAKPVLEPLSRGTTPSAGAGLLWLSRIYSRQGRHDDAVKMIEPALPRFQSDVSLPELLYDHANGLIALGKFEEASRSLAKVLPIKDWPQRNDVLRMVAVSFHRAGAYADSLKYADEFIAAYPGDKLISEVHFVRAENLYLLDKLADASAAYRAFLTGAPPQANADAATLRLAQILHKQAKWSDALEALTPLLARDPQGDVFSQLLFVAGDCHFRLGKWDEAVKHLDAFVRKYTGTRRKKGNTEVAEPNLDTAFVELAVAQLNRGDRANAAQSFRAVLTQFPQSPHAPFVRSELGRMQYEDRDYAGAKKTLQDFLTAHGDAPQRARAEYFLGWIALSQGTEDDAIPYFSSVAKNFPKDPVAPDAALQWALALLAKDKFAEAREVLANLERTYPGHSRMDVAVYSIGVTYARANEWTKAAPYFKRVLDTWPKSDIADRAAYESAWCEKGLNRKEQAVKLYEAFLVAYPDSELVPKVRTELAELTFDEKKYEEVIAQLKQSIEESKDRAVREQALYRLGTAYFNKGDHAESARTFEALLGEYRDTAMKASAGFQAGESRMNLKEYAAAREHFAQAAKSGSQQIRELALLRLGETQALTRQWKESQETYEAMMKANPKSKWIRRAQFGLGWALERQSAFEAAIAEYRKVLAQPGKDELAARAQFEIGECLFALGKHDAAIQELTRADINYRIKDWSAKALLEIGRVLEAKGDKDKAMAQFKEVMQRFPDHDAAVVAKERVDTLRRAQ